MSARWSQMLTSSPKPPFYMRASDPRSATEARIQVRQYRKGDVGTCFQRQASAKPKAICREPRAFSPRFIQPQTTPGTCENHKFTKAILERRPCTISRLQEIWRSLTQLGYVLGDLVFLVRRATTKYCGRTMPGSQKSWQKERSELEIVLRKTARKISTLMEDLALTQHRVSGDQGAA